jgi:DHA1 family bicyclomycin/chloramphenicol resistance-like MFS transporter
VCLALYTVASIGCFLAHSFPQLLFFRAAQGLSAGVGWVVGRAIVRDVLTGHDAQRLLSLITMIFGIAPAIAPVIGGLLQDNFGWHSVFIFLGLYGALQLATCWIALPETHPPEARQPFAAAPLLRNYFMMVRNARMALLCASIALNFSAFFLYVASAPAVIYDLLGLTEHHFPVLFVPGIAGIMIGAYLSGRMAGRIERRRTVNIGYSVMFGAVTLSAAYHALFPPALPWTVLPYLFYGIGMAFSGPTVQLMVLDLFPQLRGTASSLQGFTHSLCTALVAGIVSPHISGSGLTLALGAAALVTLGSLCWFGYLRMEPQVKGA